MGLGSCFCYATWLIIQTKMSERYPCHLSSAALMCTTAALQSVVLAMWTTRNKWEEWKLRWNIGLWSVAYVGIMPSAILVTLVSWAVTARGPLFVSAFNPVTLVRVALMVSLLPEEKLHVGRFILCGLESQRRRRGHDNSGIVCGTMGEGEGDEDDAAADAIAATDQGDSTTQQMGA
ncbi:WAT1-related protein At1g25270-like [Telopea speciosissima]|uniref:WAT1-related protein At1g25270-like n=1 Tax=Telopea speciosissima TaxID=54955 RepID=UPI001CC80FFC|nr:WAT1-related protein At1g25270-like [Telopea speciosissima]